MDTSEDQAPAVVHTAPDVIMGEDVPEFDILDTPETENDAGGVPEFSTASGDVVMGEDDHLPQVLRHLKAVARG